jgi:pimeloyl-ACP methyl ester carboxylesterase
LEYTSIVIDSSDFILLLYGTTQDIEGWSTWHEKFAQQGIRSISFGRSGYAGSTKMPGRITIDVKNDVAELAEALGITRMVNLGLSGGGQHAIATGLDSRTSGVVTVGSLAPYAELGQDFYKGMQQVDIDEYADALRNIEDLVTRFKGWLNPEASDVMMGSEISERDKLSQQSPTWEALTKSMNFTMKAGFDWVADDYSSYLQPWGFDPRDVKVPVVIWQGELDKNVPVVHGEWLSKHLPNNTYEFRANESHIGVFINYEDEIIASAINLLK